MCYIKNKNFLGFNYKSKRPNSIYKLFFKNTENCIEDYNHPNNKEYHYLTLYQNLLRQLNIEIRNKKHYLPFISNKNFLFDNYILIHIDERWDNYDKIYLDSFSKKIREFSIKYKLIFTSNYEGNYFYNQLQKEFTKLNNIKFIEKSSIDDLLNIIFHCTTLISSHTGFVVHAASAFNKKVIDIINTDIDRELDRWIPFDISYKRVYFNNLSDFNI